MKALIKRASLCILLMVSATSAFADLIDAQRALLNGQFSKALEFAHDIADAHPVDAALISARALIELGNPKEAERYAAFAVRVAPKSFSARLLLATAQRHQGKDFYAELNFRRALDIADTPTDRRIARDALRYVRDTKDWNYTLFLGVAPTSNIHRQSGEFLTFHPNYSIFNQQSKPIESKTGTLLSGSIARNFRFPNGEQLVFSYAQTARRYDDAGFNRDTRSLKVTWSATDGSPRILRHISLNYSNMDVAHDPYSESYSLSLGTDLRLNGLRPIGLRATLGHSNVFDIKTDGREERSIRLSYPISVGRNHHVSGYVEQFRNLSSEYIPDDTSGYEVGVKATYAPAGTGFLIDAGLSLDREEFQQRWFIDVDRRWVEKTRATLGVQNKNFSFFGLTPTVSVTREIARSNVDIAKYETTDWFFGIVNAY